MVTSNRWNYSAMLARGGDLLTDQEAEACRKLVEDRWQLTGSEDAKSGVSPRYPNIRPYLQGWLGQTPYITDPAVYQTGHGHRFKCEVTHRYSSDFESFHVDAVVAIASLTALTTLIQRTFGRDVFVSDWQALVEPF